MKKLNILITAASRRVALAKYFKKAINRNGCSGKVVATDTDPNSPALYFTDSHHLVPLSSDPTYIKTIIEICKKENIRLVVPTIDEELHAFGGCGKQFKDQGIILLTSERETQEICLDKYLTYKFFKEKGLPFANTYLPEEIEPKKMTYPLFIKPRMGRGSVHAYPVKSEKELTFFLYYIENPVVQTFLEGKEFTIDILCDLDGKVISVVPRERIVIRSGVCDRGVTVKDWNLINTSVRIAESLNIIGPANFQCKLHQGKVTFFEVNPRFSGAIQLTITAGADFPGMIVDMVNGDSLKPAIGDFRDSLTMICYEETIYRGKAEKLPHPS